MVDDLEQEYPWVANRDDRLTLAFVLDVGELLSRHGYSAPTGMTLIDLTTGPCRALQPLVTHCTQLLTGLHRDRDTAEEAPFFLASAQGVIATLR